MRWIFPDDVLEVTCDRHSARELLSDCSTENWNETTRGSLLGGYDDDRGLHSSPRTASSIECRLENCSGRVLFRVVFRALTGLFSTSSRQVLGAQSQTSMAKQCSHRRGITDPRRLLAPETHVRVSILLLLLLLLFLPEDEGCMCMKTTEENRF